MQVVESMSEQTGILQRLPDYRPARSWRTWLIGRPLATADAPHQAINKVIGLAVFSSDAMSSVAYAPQELMLILALAGAGALALSVPLAIGIVVPARHPDPVVRADDPRLPGRRRRLHRRAR